MNKPTGWRRGLIGAGLALLLTLGIVPAGVRTQADCDLADQIVYPVDAEAFTLVQGYGVPSQRHHGRYHTGEDYQRGRGQTLGEPVRAIANGRVTYSFALGWGRDAGVVIVEHRFADGTVLYTQYGHITESDTVKLPFPQTCVSAGQVIGVIADVRPAPHLHFELRTSGADFPGPGYSWTFPDDTLWRDPSAFFSAHGVPTAR